MNFHKAVKVGELVRNKLNREIWLVVDKTSQGVMVVNLQQKYTPSQVMIILPAYQSNWMRDVDIQDIEEWEKKSIERQLEVLDLKDD